ncbi:hypothetical protein F2Q69_00019977 [Brassica cretica]|uniref:Uncharacterized protein n=1 Tax=Brassica cretica TaxID=69181 RepID=A0A8S9QEM0_BRACR|nr:hypothetical protein F2Q69_00019977 [Brassica cretica]
MVEDCDELEPPQFHQAQLIHDDVELIIHGVAHREKELTRFDWGFGGGDDSFELFVLFSFVFTTQALFSRHLDDSESVEKEFHRSRLMIQSLKKMESDAAQEMETDSSSVSTSSSAPRSVALVADKDTDRFQKIEDDIDVSTDSGDYQVMNNKWLNLKNENLRLQHDLVQSREQYEDLAEELAAVGHKKVECFAREKSRNMDKKVNKTFTKPKRVEEEDQEASSVESGHGVVCDTKGKEIEVHQEVMRDDLQGRGSWSRRRHMKVARSSTEVGREVARQGENGDVLVLSMHISWGRKAWCGAHLVGEKNTFGVKVSRWGTWLQRVADVVAEADVVVSDEDHVESRDRDTGADLIEREKLLEVFWVVLKQGLKYLTVERHKRVA